MTQVSARVPRRTGGVDREVVHVSTFVVVDRYPMTCCGGAGAGKVDDLRRRFPVFALCGALGLLRMTDGSRGSDSRYQDARRPMYDTVGGNYQSLFVVERY